MPGMTEATMEQLLRADGWPLERVDGTTWRSGFRGEGERFPLYLRLTANWLYLSVVPFVTVPEQAAAELALLRRLMVLNREMNLAKFGLERREIVLTVELPSESLVWSELKDGLDALSFYALTHHPELQALAR